MIKSFDYNSPQVSEPVLGGLIKPYAYPEQKNYTVAGVEHGPGVVAALSKKADEAQAADQGVTLKGLGEGFMELPGPSDVKGLISGAIEGGKQVIQASPEKSFSNFGTPAFDRGAKVLGDTIGDAGNRIVNAISTAQDTHASLLEKGVAGGEALLGVLNALFTPITVPLATVEGIPGVGSLAEGVSALFSAIGGGASSVVDSTINRLPVSNKTKDTIRPLSEEIAALAAQIAIGGKVAKGIDTTQGLFRIADTATKITDAIKADEFVKPIIEPPKTEVKPFDYSKVPLVDSTGKQDLRTVMTNLERGGYSKGQVGAIMGKVIENNNTGRFTPKEISDVASEMLPDNPRESTAIIKDNPNFQGRQSTAPTIEAPKPTQGTPTEQGVGTALEQQSAGISLPKAQPTEQIGQTPSGLGKSIEAKAIEEKLTTGFKDVASYDSSTIKEQANLASELLGKGIDIARSVVRGETPLPDRLRGSSLIVAMEEYLKKNPNADLAYELANSPLTSAVSQAGSELGLMQNRVPDSFTAKVQEVRKAREAQVKDAPKKRATVKKQLKEATEGVNLSKDDLQWGKFLEEIIC